MKIRMIGDRPVAADGQHVHIWPDGSVHDVSPVLGASLVRDGWAVPVEVGPAESKVVAPAETKGDASEAEPTGKRKKG